MSEFLSRMLASKAREVAARERQRPLSELRAYVDSSQPVRSLAVALRMPGISVIAEIKKASPSAGVLAPTFDHRAIAKEYEAGGAAALSVLTDKEFFQGSIEFLRDVASVTTIPVLRKDFVIHEYQIYETRAEGADAVLLIARLLDLPVLRKFYEIAGALGLETLVEVHDDEDVEKANAIGASIIGINNRDLSDFSVSLDRSLKLRSKLHKGAISVSESGIKGRDDVKKLKDAGFDAILVGEGLVKQADRRRAVHELMVG